MSTAIELTIANANHRPLEDHAMKTNARGFVLFLTMVFVPACACFAGGVRSLHHGHHHHTFSHRSHSGVHLQLGHIGRLSFGHHYSSHLSHHRSHFGTHYSRYSPSYSYRSNYPSYTYRSHYPSYRYLSPSYSYRSYGVSSYSYPSCISFRIVAPQVTPQESVVPAPTAEQIYEKPKVDPPPESLPLPPTSRATPAQPPAPTNELHFAALRSQQTRTPSPEPPQALIRPTDQLGPRLLKTPVRTLVSDEETPWVAQ